MRRINLYMLDIEVGYLNECNNSYEFTANSFGLNEVSEKYPFQLRMFKLNREGTKVYNELPYPFNEFLGYVGRRDLDEKAGINQNDSDFDKIYKLAALDMVTPVFSIKQA